MGVRASGDGSCLPFLPKRKRKTDYSTHGKGAIPVPIDPKIDVENEAAQLTIFCCCNFAVNKL